MLQKASPPGPAAGRLQPARLTRWLLASLITLLCLIPPARALLQAGLELLAHSLVRQVAGFAARTLWDRLTSATAVADFTAAAAATANVTIALPTAPDLVALAWEGADGQTLGTVWTWSCLAAAGFRRIGRR